MISMIIQMIIIILMEDQWAMNTHNSDQWPCHSSHPESQVKKNATQSSRIDRMSNSCLLPLLAVLVFLWYYWVSFVRKRLTFCRLCSADCLQVFAEIAAFCWFNISSQSLCHHLHKHHHCVIPESTLHRQLLCRPPPRLGKPLPKDQLRTCLELRLK